VYQRVDLHDRDGLRKATTSSCAMRVSCIDVERIVAVGVQRAARAARRDSPESISPGALTSAIP